MRFLPLVGGEVTHLSRCEVLAEESRAFMQSDIADSKRGFLTKIPYRSLSLARER